MTLTHETLQVGSACPGCAEFNTISKLKKDAPNVFVRLVGAPIITGTRYVAECLRCYVCNERYRATVPPSIKNAPKYDASCATMLAIARYSMGLPLHRIEKHQAMQGIPVQDATQWDLLRKLYDVVSPVYSALIDLAANGDLVVYDDTTGRILENQVKGIATNTTAFISVFNNHKIHLYFTSHRHAGNNVDLILENRSNDSPVIAMMDASSKNLPKKLSPELAASFILCFCLTHGRRKFFEVFNFFDKECDLVLDIIGQVYWHDKFCKQEKMSPQERLLYHQQHSAPLMNALSIWLNNLQTYDLMEENSGLGEAVRYMLRHWHPLTTFLQVADAPLDSSWAERAIKIAIRHRRNSLFYKTNRGAQVGDCLMSLIYTAEQNGINPVDYLNALQRYCHEVKANPLDWLAWNYRESLERCSSLAAA